MAFDLIDFFQGTAAREKWQAEHKGLLTGKSPNEYLIVNDNPKIRKLKISDKAAIYMYAGNDETEPGRVDFQQFIRNYTSPFLDDRRPYWITVRDGKVVKIEEQHLPD